MKKYIKKPIPVLAYQTDVEFFIETLEGNMKAVVGSYIVTGPAGERWSVKKEIFEATYEEIKE